MTEAKQTTDWVGAATLIRGHTDVVSCRFALPPGWTGAIVWVRARCTCVWTYVVLHAGWRCVSACCVCETQTFYLLG